MKRMFPVAVLALSILLAPTLTGGLQQSGQQNPPAAQTPSAEAPPRPLPTIAARTNGMQKFDGYVPFYWDARAGKIWLEINKWNREFLYLDTLSAGMGQNDVGLDRGQRGGEHIVRFERSGPRVLLIQPNYAFRAITDNADERRSVEESFAQSAIFGFDVAAEEGSSVLVDATNFFIRDAHNVISTLRRSQQGTFRLDSSRCAFYLPNTKNFPKNTEVEATLTFVSDEPGPLVREVTPDPSSMTLRQHHSFIELPPAGYKPREYDPRSSFFGIQFMDMAAPVGEPWMKRYISRHRLQKKNPSAAVSEAVQPIVYYVDSATPEPIRSALVEGASWWNQAFTAAGFKDAFQVKVLPQGESTLDIRYNVIQWVHRGERGWSNGSPIIDPRTGEIIKGIVTLGSLRDRQDYLIAEGLLAPYAKSNEVSAKAMQMVLSRMRQLAAHEVGHTLGLQHNFSASTVGRASVMDYPPPVATIGADGVPDLGNAYAVGIGDWDKVSIAYGYSDFAPGTDEHAALNKIMNDAYSRGQRYLTDQDARPASAASPYAHLWDSGSNAVDALTQTMKVRAAALQRFGENNIRTGAPLATLEDVLVPLYMFHRYQVEAAAKVIGGVDYSFALRGDALAPLRPVPPAEQRRALEAVLATLTPDALALPDSLLKIIPPRPPDYPQTREDFRRRTYPTFDALAPAEAASSHIVSFLFDPARAERLVEAHALDSSYPGFAELVDKVLAETWSSKPAVGYAGEIQRVVDQTVLYDLISLAADANAANQVRAIASLKLDTLKSHLDIPLMNPDSRPQPDDEWRAAYFFAVEQIKLFQSDPKKFDLTKPVIPPDGQPIGDDEDWSWR